MPFKYNCSGCGANRNLRDLNKRRLHRNSYEVVREILTCQETREKCHQLCREKGPLKIINVKGKRE